MKNFILPILFFLSHIVLAQEKMITDSGIVNFEASVPLFEEVKASNKIGHCVLNSKNGEISIYLLIKDFHFKIDLMEKHFNNYYLESDRYPKSSFKGRIEGFNLNIIGTSPKEFKLKGKLTLHGKSKEINTFVWVRKLDEGFLEITSNFDVKSKDFNIEIPVSLSVKVAETVNIKSYFLLK
jgi:hypothetical protein